MTRRKGALVDARGSDSMADKLPHIDGKDGNLFRILESQVEKPFGRTISLSIIATALRGQVSGRHR